MECLFDGGEVTHGEVDILELAVLGLLLDDIINEFTDAGLVWLLEAAGGGLYRVADHQHGGLLGERRRTVVSEIGGIDLLIGMLTFFHNVEILSTSCAVVGTDELDDLLRQTSLLGHLDAIEHMGDDDLGALHIRDVVMRVVASVLVLSEIHRVLHLSDVVIQGTGTGQQVVASNGI